MKDSELLKTFYLHMQAILDNDVETYRQTVIEDLTMYEWWVTPHRIDGVPFHEFMMTANSSQGTVFGSDSIKSSETRFDYANLKVQQYGEAAIISFTLLVSSTTPQSVVVKSHNESRVMVKLDGSWKVVHVHKSPAWGAPHLPPVQ